MRKINVFTITKLFFCILKYLLIIQFRKVKYMKSFIKPYMQDKYVNMQSIMYIVLVF